jgi:hypothetical protein
MMISLLLKYLFVRDLIVLKCCKQGRTLCCELTTYILSCTNFVGKIFEVAFLHNFGDGTVIATECRVKLHKKWECRVVSLFHITVDSFISW